MRSAPARKATECRRLICTQCGDHLPKLFCDRPALHLLDNKSQLFFTAYAWAISDLLQHIKESLVSQAHLYRLLQGKQTSPVCVDRTHYFRRALRSVQDVIMLTTMKRCRVLASCPHSLSLALQMVMLEALKLPIHSSEPDF